MKSFFPLCILALVLLSSCSQSSNKTASNEPINADMKTETDSNPNTSRATVAKAEPAEEIRVNGKALTKTQLAQFKELYKVEPKPGNYWYDSVSGLYGTVSQPASGFMYPGHDFGSLTADASAGDPSVFVNGRQLPQSEWFIWSTMLGAGIQPGRYWFDAKGNAGYEGVATPLVNLYVAAAQNAQNRAGGGGGDNGWSTRFSSGNYNSDNSAGYVSVPGVGVIGSYGY